MPSEEVFYRSRCFASRSSAGAAMWKQSLRTLKKALVGKKKWTIMTQVFI